MMIEVKVYDTWVSKKLEFTIHYEGLVSSDIFSVHEKFNKFLKEELPKYMYYGDFKLNLS
jgi:hypothetical protein